MNSTATSRLEGVPPAWGAPPCERTGGKHSSPPEETPLGARPEDNHSSDCSTVGPQTVAIITAVRG